MFTECILLKTYYGEVNQKRMEITDNNICVYHKYIGQKDTLLLLLSLQSCPTLCDPIDSSPPGSPVPGVLQARTLEWVAISFSNA